MPRPSFLFCFLFLSFKGGKGIVSYCDAEGNQRVDGLSITSACRWLGRLGIALQELGSDGEDEEARVAAS